DDASVVAPDTNTVAEDTPATGNVLGNDSDVDNTLTVASFSVAGVTGSFTAGSSAVITGVGVLTVATNGNYTFTPVQNWNGEVPEVTYVTNTGSETTLNITVTPVNDAPLASNDGPIAVTEDTPVIGNVLTNDSDIDGDSLTVTQFEVNGSTYTAGQTATLSGVGTLVINANGSFTFTPASNYTGPVPAATYTVTDGTATDTGELSFADVTPVNDAPLAANDGPIAVTEDSQTVGNVLTNDSDPENDALTVTGFDFGGNSYLAGQTATITGVGSLVINANGSFTFTPAANYTGPVPTATYTVSDGNLTDTAELSLSGVSPVNDAPETNAASGSGNEGAAGIPVALTGSDVDGTVDHFVIKSLPANGTLFLNGAALAIGDSVPATGNGASITFVPSANWNGTTDFQYASVDNQGLEDGTPATGTITVASINDAPETAAASGSGNEDSTGIPVALSGSDLDGTVDHFVIKS
ncbi:tandem-95 repeat protein, partial [Pseudomonas sp. OTU5201]|uniref:tandem-95 repeat protein n=1 Tax=Pseudomonas sp. OTU5201 TaxID=3043850 RepID=UPI00313CB17D